MSTKAAVVVVLLAVALALASSASPSSTSPRWYHTLYSRLPTNVQSGIDFVTEALSNERFVPSAADIQYIKDNYASDGRAKTVHDRIPRFGYSNDLVAVVLQAKEGSLGFDGEVKSYAIGLAILFGVGLIIAFLTLLCAIIYAICKCCKCCCCRGDQIPLFKERKVCPMVTLLIACLTASAFGVLGIVYNEKLHADIGGSEDGIVGTAINTLGKSSTFLSNISVPIRDVQFALPVVINNVLGIISNTESIVSYGITNLTMMMENEANYIGNPPVNFTISNSTYPCSYCADAYTQVMDAVGTINSNAASTISSMRSILASAQSDVISRQTEITNRLNDVFDNIADVQQQLLDKKYQAQYQTRDVSSRDNQRRIGTLVLLLLPASALILGVIGLVVRKALPFQILYWFSFVMVFFTALIFAITLPLSAVMGDSCVFMDTIDPDITQYDLVTNDSARIAFSCLTNAWVLGPNVLNLSSELNFTNNLNFNDRPEIYTPASQYLNFTELDRFALQVINLDTRTFGYDPAVTDGLLADINRLTSQYWTRANVTSSTPDPNAYPSMSSQNKSILAQERDAVVSYVQVETTLNTFLAQLRQNVSNITTYANDMKTALTNAQNQIINLQGLLAPILDPANRLLDMAYCGFLGDSYKDLKHLYCNNIMAEVSYLCLAVFIITLMGIFMIIFGAHMANLEGQNADAKKYDEDNPAADGDVPLKPMDGSQPQVLPMGAGQPQPYAGPYGAQSMPIQPYQTSQGMGFKNFLADGFSSPSAPASAPPAAYGAAPDAPPPYQPSSPQPLLPQNRSARVEITDMSPAAPSSRVSAASANLSPALAAAHDSTGEGEATQ